MFLILLPFIYASSSSFVSSASLDESSSGPSPMLCSVEACSNLCYPRMEVCMLHHRLKDFGCCTFPDCPIPAQSKEINLCVNHRARPQPQLTSRTVPQQTRRIVRLPSPSFPRLITFEQVQARRQSPSSPRSFGMPPTMPRIVEEGTLSQSASRCSLKRSATSANLADLDSPS